MVRRIAAVLISVLLIAFSGVLSAHAAEPAIKFKFDDSKPSPTKLGYAGYAAELDKYLFSGQLGAIYSQESTTFRLWSPVASSVSVCIYKTGSDDEQGAGKVSVNPMKYSQKYGTWYITLNGDFKNLYYTYRVTVAGQTNEVVDPYAKAVGVNGNRGMVVDLAETNPEGWEDDSFARVAYGTEAVVWEVSVRDFSADPSSGVSLKNRGKFLAFTETGTTLNSEGSISTCVDYLKQMGIKYVQINPFYDFASIDEADTATPQYNWGYDPKNYNVPEGSYSSDPYDGRVRIRECKAMIRALHEAGIGVIMDVVYNHTYFSEDSFFNMIAPYYYHRINEDGTWSNGSGCGNDVATERIMVRRFIRDSVTYWAQEYHIDGFRFDLMGLMDVTTMNSIRVALDQLPGGNSIIMYGEAWKMNTTVPSGVNLANQDNVSLLSKRIGAFNDTARDGIRQFVREGTPKNGVRSSVSAEGGGWTDTPDQCVNYVSCHDNLTLYDYLVNNVYRDKQYDLRRDDLVAMNQLAAAIIMTSRGMPFMLAGEEMGRTKGGDGNSYISPIEVNRIDWNQLRTYTSMVDYYKGLIQLRSAIPALADPTGNRSTLTYLETKDKGAVAFTSGAQDSPTVVAAFNGNPVSSTTISLPDGKWIILADRNRAGLKSLGTAEGTLTVEPTSAVILIDAQSYPSLASGDEAVVYVRYVDADTSNVIREQRAGGKMGEKFSFAIPIDIAFQYDFADDKDALNGVFDAPFAVITLSCKLYQGEFSTVTFFYVDQSDREITENTILSSRVGQQYYTPMIPYVDGYRLDLERLPDNGAGVVTDDPIRVVYYYKSDAGESGSDQMCRVNLIYMAEDGEILDTDELTGAPGNFYQVDQKTINGCEFERAYDYSGVFSAREVNIILFYVKIPADYTKWYVVAAAVPVLALGAFFLVRFFNRRRLIRSIDIDE